MFRWSQKYTQSYRLIDLFEKHKEDFEIELFEDRFFFTHGKQMLTGHCGISTIDQYGNTRLRFGWFLVQDSQVYPFWQELLKYGSLPWKLEFDRLNRLYETDPDHNHQPQTYDSLFKQTAMTAEAVRVAEELTQELYLVHKLGRQ